MSRAVWVTRDGVYGCRYKLWGRKPVYEEDGEWRGYRYIVTFDTTDFERITGFRLKPGEGPVKVMISVKPSRKERAR